MDAMDAAGDIGEELVSVLEQVPMFGAAFKLITLVIKRARGVQVRAGSYTYTELTSADLGMAIPS